ncbi:melanoma-associated antigen 10-like [Octodon degus]|uniref:Melanoma-associated antigen 10-like n=1 Tax=Octodon degus TaxID=10160 RepID=A0A6P3FFU8_OCTDE|nr:melanoma-associated antigen 10-like [Octodon degus]
MASSQSSQYSEGTESDHEECPCTSADPEGPQPLPDEVLYNKIDELMEFLLLKYSNKEPATKADMLHVVRGYEEHFPLILSKVFHCLYMVFGIDAEEVNAPGHTYALVPVLGLTHNREVGGEQEIPKTSLLILILSIIFIKENHASEEVVWDMLSRMQVFDGTEHDIYGEPRKFLTEDLVQEGYLVYQQVPDSDPARYEFLWGPRAYTETSKMRVLEHLAKVHGCDPQSYPRLYEEALEEEQVAPLA